MNGMKKWYRYRMLNIVAVVFAMLCVVSCNDDAPETAPDKLAIDFVASIADDAKWNGTGSRTIKDESNDTEFANGDEVIVDAWILKDGASSDTSEPDILYRQPMTYDKENDTWVYSPKKYWPNIEGGKLAFFSYYLDGANTERYTVNQDWDSTTGYPTIEFVGCVSTDVLATPISIFAQNELTNGKIPLNYQHIMARYVIKIRYWCDEWEEAKNADPNFEPADNEKNIYLESITYWNYPYCGTFEGFDEDLNPVWNFDMDKDGDNIKDDHMRGKGVFVARNLALEASDEFQLVDIEYHYPHNCDDADPTENGDVDKDKFGFKVYKKYDGNEYSDPFESGNNNIEMYFNSLGQLKGGHTYTFNITINPRGEILVNVDETSDSPNWSGEGSNFGVNY